MEEFGFGSKFGSKEQFGFLGWMSLHPTQKIQILGQ